MAANDPDSESRRPLPQGQGTGLSASALQERLRQEIALAEREGNSLSCLLVTIEDIDELARRYGSELADHALEQVEAALRGELRRSDAIGRPSHRELLVVLPGADGPRGEIVAKRVLDRLRRLEVEAEGVGRPVRISVALATWRAGLTGEDLLAQSRTAATMCSGNGASQPLARPGAE
jgi:diguanylate cyclase (GGDEF)-like protein